MNRHHSLSWALWGSTAYEIIITIHRIAIFSLLDKQAYGFLVTLLSIIHLGIHIADFGASNSSAPLLHHFTKSRQHFTTMLWRYSLLPHLPLVFITTGTLLWYTTATSKTLGWGQVPWTVGALIIVETIEAFMRQFLYAIGYVRETVIIETTELIARLCMIWILFFGCKFSITPELILYSHLIEASSICILFIFCLRNFYKTLPERGDTADLSDSSWRFGKLKLSNYMVRLSRNIFTTNFLTPLFAVQFGLKTAGIFYFASKLTKIALAAVKITIGYTGSGLLAQAKYASHEVKKSIFALLSNKLTSMCVPMVLLFIPACLLEC